MICILETDLEVSSNWLIILGPFSDIAQESFDFQPNQTYVDKVCAVSDKCANVFDNVMQILGVRGDFKSGNCYQMAHVEANCGTPGWSLKKEGRVKLTKQEVILYFYIRLEPKKQLGSPR